MTRAGYQPEVDGLRAVAVVAIVLFHLDIERLSGGFVGVDVFFVISGFLISRLVRRDVANEQFRFRDFYARRIRRLLPALLVTLAATLLAGYWIELPKSFAQLATDTLYATFSLANIEFSTGTGYFDQFVGPRALLHTWSLSVEEQFYLVWPALIWLLSKRGAGRALPWAIGMLSLLTLVVAELALESDPSGVFYLTPFRIWEFGLGALILWAPSVERAPRWASEAALASGLSMVLWSVFRYDHDTSFPGVAALLPCVGTALCIWAGPARYLGALLRNPLSVGIGKISYSLYLVHWPLIVLSKRVRGDVLSGGEQLVLGFVSVVLAVVLFFGVEQRLRYKKAGSTKVSGRTFAFGTVVAVVGLSGSAVYVHAEEGLASRYPPAIRKQLAEGDRVQSEELQAWQPGRCFLYHKTPFQHFDKAHCLKQDPSRRNVLLVGDSTAAHLVFGLDAVHGKELNIMQATVATCRGKRLDTDETCRAVWQLLLDTWIPRHAAEIDAVVLAVLWQYEALLPWARRILTKLASLGVPVVLVGPPVSFEVAPALALGSRFGPARTRASLREGELDTDLRLPLDELQASVPRMDRALRSVAQEVGVAYLSPLDKQCTKEGCLIIIPTEDGGQTLIQRDSVHYTRPGSRWLAEQLQLGELVPKPSGD